MSVPCTLVQEAQVSGPAIRDTRLATPSAVLSLLWDEAAARCVGVSSLQDWLLSTPCPARSSLIFSHSPTGLPPPPFQDTRTYCHPWVWAGTKDGEGTYLLSYRRHWLLAQGHKRALKPWLLALDGTINNKSAHSYSLVPLPTDGAQGTSRGGGRLSRIFVGFLCLSGIDWWG